jgi:hypothetical protein
MEIAPEGTPARFLTAASFSEICAVEDKPSSVFTCENDI